MLKMKRIHRIQEKYHHPNTHYPITLSLQEIIYSDTFRL